MIVLIFLLLLILIIFKSVTGRYEKIEIKEYNGENLEPYLLELNNYEGQDHIVENKNNFCFVIIYYNDIMAGFVKKYNCNIGSLFIIPKFRNLGLGSKLIKYVLNPENKINSQCKNTICKEIFVGILKTNPQYEKLKNWYIHLGLNKLLFENYRGIGLFHSGEANKISLDKMYELAADITKKNISEKKKREKIEIIIKHFIGKVQFHHYNFIIQNNPYSILDNHSSYGERLIRFLADPLCISYIGKNSRNKKLINNTILYTFTIAFKRSHECFILLEPYEEYPVYYAGKKNPSIII